MNKTKSASIGVRFSKVGRRKLSWRAVLGEVTQDTMVQEIKKNGGLMSSDIDFSLNETLDGGTVVVGGFRSVGTFVLSRPLTSSETTEASQG